MPLVEPKPGETREEFIGRCMGSEVMRREFPDQKQRAGVCYTQWREAHGEKEPKPKQE